MYDRKTINELNALSKQVFGSTSKWKKMIELGVPELVEEDIEKMGLKDGKEVTEVVKTPVLHKDQLHQYHLHRYDVNSVREFMLMAKDRQEQLRQAIARIEAQQKAAEAAKATAESASGSSI